MDWRLKATRPLTAFVVVALLWTAGTAPVAAADPTAAPAESGPAGQPVASPAPSDGGETGAPSVPNVSRDESAAAPAPTPTSTPTPGPTPAPSDPTPAAGTIGLLPPLPPGATELVDRRTETTRSYRDASGKAVTESYTSPVFFRPSVQAPLQPIRLGYQRAADGKGAVSKTAPLEVAVEPATSATGFLQVAAGNHTITYRPLTKAGLPSSSANAAVIDGAAADLKDVIPGVDLRVLARADTASVFFILDQAADASKLTFAIDAPGLTAVVNADGQVVFSDASGTEIARMSHPWSMDSTPDTTGLGSGRMTGAVSVALSGKASPYTATVTVDQAWLKSAVYPVYVDPTLSLADTSSSDDAFVNAGNNIVYGEYCRPDSPFYCELWLGQSPSPTTDVATVYMKWVVTSLTGQGIDTASFQFFPYHQWSHATAKNTWVWQVGAGTGAPWSESTLKYSNRPTAVVGSARTDTTVEDAWSDIDIAPIVRNWTSGDYANYGLRIDENGNNYTYWKRVVSVEQTSSYVHVPRIVYTSHTLGATPVPAITEAPARLLQWTYANSANKAQTQFQVEVATDAGFTAIVASSGTVSQSVAAGGTGSWTVPALTDLTKYWWRVRVNDGTGWSNRTAVSTPFTYDAIGRGAEPWWSSIPFDLGGGLGLDVAAHTGEARLSRSLYDMPTIGPSHSLALRYSSLNVATADQLGFGWSSNLTQTLSRDSATAPTKVTWNRDDGARVLFTGSGTTFTPLADHFETLTISGTEWTVKLPDQTRLVFSLPSGALTGKLARIEDRFGKQLVFTWGATSATVASASAPGVTTTLNYPGGTLITTVVDPAGRTWTLGYTGSDLTSITEPDPDGTGSLAAPVTTIGYATHLVTTVTRARRTAAGGTDNLVWTIAYTSGRVTSVIDPIANAQFGSVASTFTYNTGNTVAALLKTYSPATRNSTTFYLDGAGRATRTDDPLGSQTTSTWNAASTIASTTMNGIQTAYTYSTDGRANLLTETLDPGASPHLNKTTKYDYNTSNDVIKTYVAFGSPDEVDTTYGYDTLGTGGAPGHLTSVTLNSAGTQPAVTTHAYNANDQLVASRDPLGAITTYAYNGVNQTQAISNCVDSLPPANWYECSGTAPHTASVNVTTSAVFSLTASIRLGLTDTTSDANGRQTTYLYDALGRVMSETPPEGQTTREWDQLGNELRATAPGSQVTTQTYDLDNRATAIVRPGQTTTMTFDAAGSIVSTTVAGETTTSTYDAAGNLVSETIDPGTAPHLNLTTQYFYDALGREVASRRPAPTLNQADLKTITRTWYDVEGRVTKVVENCTNTTTTIPDIGWESCAGTGTKDATWNVTTTTTYDNRGNRVSETTPNGRITTYTYDALDRLTKVVDNDVASPTGPTQDVTTEYAYDANGNQTAVKSPTTTGGTTVARTLYDNLGRRTTTIANCTDSGTPPPWQSCGGTGTADASTNVVTTYSYDAAGNQVSVTAPDPSATSGTATTVTRNAYDTAGRLCRVLENASVDLQALADPCVTAVSGTATSNVSTRYTYDTIGNLATMVDGAGHTTTYGYDAKRRMTSLLDALNVPPALGWLYDDVANSKTQTNRTDSTPATPTITWAYDAAGRVTSRTYLDEAGATRTTTYAYDNASNLASATDNTTSITISIVSDRLRRPTSVSVSNDAGATTSYSYNFTAPTRTDASGAYTMAVDPFGRVTSLTDPIHGLPFTWTYGADGQPITATTPNTNSTSLTYDSLGRLLTKTTGARASYSYTYNRAGQRLTEASTITGDAFNGTATFGYDKLGRLTNYGLGANTRTSTWQAVPNRDSLAVNGGAPVAQTFNNANRPNSNGYAFDADGRMTNRPGASGAYLEWDSLGRLIRVRTAQGGAIVAQYTYDALDRLRTVERSGTRIRFRYQGTSTAVAQVVDDIGGSVLRNVAVGPDGTPLEDWLTTSRRIYGTNGHHDTTWTADDTGAVTATLRYDPWGNLLGSTGTLPDWRFQGSWLDASTNLAWAIARWYDPALGSFISEDSRLGEPASPGSGHLYAYAEGNPVGAWDPAGTASTTAGFANSVSTGFCAGDRSEWSRETDGLYARAYAFAPLPVIPNEQRCGTHIDSEAMRYGGLSANFRVPKRFYTVQLKVNFIRFRADNGAYAGFPAYDGEWGYEVWRYTPKVWIKVKRYVEWGQKTMCGTVLGVGLCTDNFGNAMDGVRKIRSHEIFGPILNGDKIVVRAFINVRAIVNGGWASTKGEMDDLEAKLSW